VGLTAIERKSVEDLDRETAASGGQGASGDESTAGDEVAADGPIVIDVRTPMEFTMGAYPGAINISLDDLPSRVSELGGPEREIVVYCASGARSAYAQRVLAQLGYTNVRNGGGLHDMMAAGV